MLALCLDRLAPGKQTMDASFYEVIVTDDGKNNEAKELVHQNYSWAKWVEGPKKGPAANRNNGAKYSIGIWIVFLDDDCLPETGLLNNYRWAIETYPNQIFEGSIFPSGKRPGPRYYAPLNTQGGVLWSCNFCISNKLFSFNQGFDEGFKYAHLEDKEFYQRLLSNKEEIKFVKECKVIHPWRKQSPGYKIALHHQCDVYYYFKVERRIIKLHQVFEKIVRSRIGSIRNYPVSFKSIGVFYHLLMELMITTINYKKWIKQLN